jgi:hypothetical protein
MAERKHEKVTMPNRLQSLSGTVSGALRRILFVAAALCVSIDSAPALDKVPLTNRRSASMDKQEPLEVEVMEVYPLSAAPNRIQRPGKFILLLANRTTDANAAIVLEPAAKEGGSPVSLVRWGGRNGWSNQRRASAAIIDQPPGEYQLKSSATGAVLGTITVEQPQ